VLVVGKLDRLGRSLAHLIATVAALERRGVGLRSLTEAIDTTTAGGRLIFHVFGALSQFERARALLAQGLNARERAMRLKVSKAALHQAPVLL
jgi:Resolvase, N terminal domain